GPFFSPDGAWLGFFADGKLKKIRVAGGAPVTLADAPNDRGGTWAEDGSIVFEPDVRSVLMRMSSAGGSAERLTTFHDRETTHRWPQVLPGGTAILYTAHDGSRGFENAGLVAMPLPSGTPKVLFRNAYYGRYLPSGHLAFVHEGSLFAAPFDPGRLEVT